MDFVPLLFFFVIIIPSAILHEFAHGWMANRLGDPTARYAGRLTLDPRAHIDPFGTLVMPLMLFVLTQGTFIFAYAKPVPYNPYNLKDAKWGPLWVAVAGPAANLLLAAVFGTVIRLIGSVGVFTVLLSIIVYANVLLAVFNLIPIPPLDGSKILYAILPESMDSFRAFLDKYGIIILLIFILFFFQLIVPVILYLHLFFTGGIVPF